MSEENHQKGEKLPKDVIFFQLFMDSQRKLHSYILASIHNYADANDILQETATVMWRKFNEFDQNTSFIAWAISIARNLIRNYFNKRKRLRLQFDDELVQSIETRTIQQLIDGDNEKLEALEKCCEKLTDLNRYILKLRYRDGMTIKSIASRLGKSISGMYKFMARLQDSLLKCVEKTMIMREKSI